MNSIKFFKEQERVKIVLDFDGIEAAREWFSNEECIEDVQGILGVAETDEAEEEVSEAEERLNEVKNKMREILSKVDYSLLGEFSKMVCDELYNRK